MKKKEQNSGVNLLDLRPSRSYEWESEAGETVVVLVPKFRNRFLVQWLLPRLRNPFFRVKLDAFGSHVWMRCDGQKTVEEIGHSLHRRFGDQVEPVYNRLAAFIKRLERDHFIRFADLEQQHHL